MVACSSFLFHQRFFGHVLGQILWGNASLSCSSRCQNWGEGTGGQFFPPHMYKFTSFSDRHVQGSYKQRSSSENISHAQLILSPGGYHSTSFMWGESTGISVQCFSNYRVLMNHLRTWQKYRFKFNRSAVEPKCLHFEQASVDSDAADLQTTLEYQNPSISLWLVIYQEN